MQILLLAPTLQSVWYTVYMNSKQQSSIGIARAISYFTNKGYSVFIPVSDCNRYDLLIDTGENILRVEVKTTTQKSGQTELRTLGGNQSWNGIIKFISSKDCDIVFIVNLITGAEKEFLIEELELRRTVTVK